MKRLIIKKLIVISQIESRSLEVRFKEGLNIILGGNKTGKSSIIKSIFTTFGCECTKNESDWKKLISYYMLFFQYGDKQLLIVRQEKTFQIFQINNDYYSCIIETEKFHEYSNCLMELLEIKMPCISKNGETLNITPPLLFRFQYIDQDDGWNKIGESFGNAKYIKDWKKNTESYVCGYLTDKYYILQAEKETIKLEKENKQREVNNNTAFVSQIRDSIKVVNETNYNSFEELSSNIENLIKETEEMRKNQYLLSYKIKDLENEIYVNQHKLKIVEHSINETQKDIQFAMANEDELVCPTCGSVFNNRLEEQLGISADYAHCEKLEAELHDCILNSTKMLEEMNNEYKKNSSCIYELEERIRKSQELVSYSNLYKNRGQYEILKSCEKQLKTLNEELDGFVLDISKKEKEIDDLKSRKRAKEIKEQIEHYCSIVADRLNVPRTYIKLNGFVQRIDRTGSDTPKLVYMYQSALYLYNLERLNCPFNFFVVDTPNQQGQDEENLKCIFNSLELFLSINGQVIVGTERKTGIEEKANNIITLTEKRKCLNDNDYKKHIELIDVLQKIANEWVKGSIEEVKL